jgi:hypothetical protein
MTTTVNFGSENDKTPVLITMLLRLVFWFFVEMRYCHCERYGCGEENPGRQPECPSIYGAVGRIEQGIGKNQTERQACNTGDEIFHDLGVFYQGSLLSATNCMRLMRNE